MFGSVRLNRAEWLGSRCCLGFRHALAALLAEERISGIFCPALGTVHVSAPLLENSLDLLSKFSDDRPPLRKREAASGDQGLADLLDFLHQAPLVCKCLPVSV